MRSQPQAAADLLAAEHISPLGQGEFRVKRGEIVLRGGLAALTFAGSLAAMLAGVFLWSFAYRTFGPAVVPRMSAPAFSLSAFLFILACLAGISLLRALRHRVRAGNDGLTIQGVFRATHLPWDQIQEIRTAAVRYGLLRRPSGPRSNMVLRSKAGRVYSLSDNLSDFKSLLTTVKSHVYPLLLETYREEFNRGESITFAKLKLTQDRLEIGGKRFDWQSVRSASMDAGMLSVHTAHAKKADVRIPSQAVPNIELCLQLIQQLATNENPLEPQDQLGEERTT